MMHEWASRKDVANALQGSVRTYQGRFALVELAAGALHLAGGPTNDDVSAADFAALLKKRRSDLEARAPAPPDTILAWRESAQHRMEEPMAVPTESLTFTEVGEVTVS